MKKKKKWLAALVVLVACGGSSPHSLSDINAALEKKEVTCQGGIAETPVSYADDSGICSLPSGVTVSIWTFANKDAVNAFESNNWGSSFGGFCYGYVIKSDHAFAAICGQADSSVADAVAKALGGSRE